MQLCILRGGDRKCGPQVRAACSCQHRCILTVPLANMGAARLRIVWVLLLISSVCAFDIATLRDGHGWGDDFAQYLMHARNLVEHRPYAQTRYVYNKLAADVGPRSYPPGFPVLLAVPYAIWGLNWQALKSLSVIGLTVSLAGFAALVWRDLATGPLLVLLAAVGFNPRVWLIKENIGSDLVFLMFVSIALLTMKWAMGRPGGNPLLIALAVAITSFCAMATRTVGAVLPAAFVLTDIIRHRRIRAVSWSVMGFSLCLIAAQAKLVGLGEASYLDQFHGLPPVLPNIQTYSVAFELFWAEPHDLMIARVIILMTAPLAILGFYSRIRRQIEPMDTFAVLYVASLLIFPTTQGARFLLPMFPLYLIYAMTGFEIAQARHPRVALAGGVLLAILASGAYGIAYSRLLKPRTTFANPEFRELCTFLRTRFPAGTIAVFAKPRALSLLAEQPAARYPLTNDAGEMQENLAALHAELLVTSADTGGDFEYDHVYLRHFIDATGPPLIYDNGRYAVYLIGPHQ